MHYIGKEGKRIVGGRNSTGREGGWKVCGSGQGRWQWKRLGMQGLECQDEELGASLEGTREPQQVLEQGKEEVRSG